MSRHYYNIISLNPIATFFFLSFITHWILNICPYFQNGPHPLKCFIFVLILLSLCQKLPFINSFFFINSCFDFQYFQIDIKEANKVFENFNNESLPPFIYIKIQGILLNNLDSKSKQELRVRTFLTYLKSIRNKKKTFQRIVTILKREIKFED